MEDFAEIFPGGFKIEFSPHSSGLCIVTIEPSALTGPFTRPVLAPAVIIDGQGNVLEMAAMPNSPYLRTQLTHLVSDHEGLFGRVCPSCKGYFRTNCLRKKKLICPYCSFRDDIGTFVTENQMRFMEILCQASYEAVRRNVKLTFDISEAVKGLKDNRPKWVYSEKNQQHSFTCNECKEYMINIVFNILGEYGSCPSCGKRNYHQVFPPKMKFLQDQFEQKNASLKDEKIRGEEWKRLLTDCVSQFDSLANDVRDQLLRIPTTPARKNDISNLSFQGIIKAGERLKTWYGIEMLKGLSEDDCTFFNKMFQRRHLVIHTGNRVDEDYLKNTNDTTVSLHQTIRIGSREIRRLIPLTERVGNNLIRGYELIE